MLLYSRALAIPAESMLIGNLHADTAPIEERFGVAIGPGPLLLGDLRKLTPLQQEWYSQKIRWFKRFRSETSLNDSFFPLGEWVKPGVKNWDGFARLSRRNGGIVVVFRNESTAKEATVRLSAPRNASYEARSVMSGRALGNVTTGLLHGWAVPLVDNFSVEIIELIRQEEQ